MKTIEQFREKKEELVKEYQAMPKIKLDIDDKYIPKHLDNKAFLEWLVNVGVAMYDTVDETGKVLCAPYKNRSMPDLYNLHNRYKSIDLEELITNLLALTRESRLQTYYCSQILRRVWFSVHYGHAYKDDVRNLTRHTAVLLDKGITNCIPLTELIDYEFRVKNPRRRPEPEEEEEEPIERPRTTRRNARTNTGGEIRWGTAGFYPVGDFFNTGDQVINLRADEPMANTVPVGEPTEGERPLEGALIVRRRDNEGLTEFHTRLRYIFGENVTLNGNAGAYARENPSLEVRERFNRVNGRPLTSTNITRCNFESNVEFARRVNFIAGRRQMQEDLNVTSMRIEYMTPDMLDRQMMDYNHQNDGVHVPRLLRVTRRISESMEQFVNRMRYVDGALRGQNAVAEFLTQRTPERMARYNQMMQIVTHLERNSPFGDVVWPDFTNEYVNTMLQRLNS